MDVLHINVRLSEGGAARVALDLHNRMRARGINSHFAYGYGKGIRRSADEMGIGDATMVGSKASTLFNFALHWLLGYDLLKPAHRQRSKLVDLIDACDVVHLHVLHSYFMNFSWLAQILAAREKAVVWTLHDYWPFTGRCAFTDQCDRWRTGCGACPTGKNYPPAKIDISGTVFLQRRSLVAKLSPRTAFVCPSYHVYLEAKAAFPNGKLIHIANGLDREVEQALANSRSESRPNSGSTRLLVIAHDLSYQGKTNRELIQRLQNLPRLEILTVGKNSPFAGENVRNLGEVRSREELASIYRNVDAMIFSSEVDTFGLVIAEALCSGTPVLATKSDAAQEVLGMIGGTSLAVEEVERAVRDRQFFTGTGDYRTPAALAERAVSVFSGGRMVDEYLEVYRSVQ